MNKKNKDIFEVKLYKEVDTKLTPSVHDNVRNALTVFINQEGLNVLLKAWSRDVERKCLVRDNDIVIGLELDNYEAFTYKQTPITGIFSVENNRIYKEKEEEK